MILRLLAATVAGKLMANGLDPQKKKRKFKFLKSVQNWGIILGIIIESEIVIYTISAKRKMK